MSASLGSDLQDITTLVALMRFDGILWYSISLPPLYEEYLFVPPTEEQKRAEMYGFRPLEALFKEWLVRRLSALAIRLPTLDSKPLEARELDYLTWQIEHAPDGENRSLARVSLAAYKKLLYAWRAFMVDGYETFLVFVEKMIERIQKHARGWRSDTKLLGHKLFRRIVATARQYRGKHPKEVQVINALAREARCGHRAIAFFSNRGAAVALTRALREQGVAAEFVFGSSSMRHDERTNVMNRFRQGKTLVLLATSVIEEGISVPEVALVVDASTANEVKSRRQRSGRTARMRPGRVLHIILEHPFDLRTFYAVHRKLKSLEREEEALASGERFLQIQYSLFP
jgi:ERCC4-related helicase